MVTVPSSICVITSLDWLTDLPLPTPKEDFFPVLRLLPAYVELVTLMALGSLKAMPPATKIIFSSFFKITFDGPEKI